MSNILRRPMFRGGRVDSRGTGITSGLGYANGGRIGLAQSYPGTVGQKQQAKGLEAVLAGINKPTTGADLLKLDPNLQVNPLSLYLPSNTQSIGSGFGFLSPSSQFPDQYLEFLKPEKAGYVTDEQGDLVRDKQGNLIPIGKDKPEDFRKFLEQSTTRRITESDTQGSEEQYGITEKDKVKPVYNNKGEITGYKGSQVKTVNENIPNEGTTGGAGGTSNREREESIEYTVEDYIKMLGGDQAMRRDLSDMLGRASAAFLKRPARGDTRGIVDALGDFAAMEAAAGPGRREKIEQAAATLDIQDKIAAKRSKEQVQLMKSKIDYELGAKEDLAKRSRDIKSMPTQDALTFVSTEVYRGQEGRSSAKVLKDVLDIKLGTTTQILTVNQIKDLGPKGEKLPVGITIVNSGEGRKVYQKDSSGNVALVDINNI
jgi:hypothetical protein